MLCSASDNILLLNELIIHHLMLTDAVTCSITVDVVFRMDDDVCTVEYVVIAPPNDYVNDINTMAVDNRTCAVPLVQQVTNYSILAISFLHF